MDHWDFFRRVVDAWFPVPQPKSRILLRRAIPRLLSAAVKKAHSSTMGLPTRESYAPANSL